MSLQKPNPTLTQKSLLTSDIFDLWRLPKHWRRTGWR